jgi:hypothetical protein
VHEHEHDRNAVALGLVVQLAARHPQDRHNAQSYFWGNGDEENRNPQRRRAKQVA